MVDGIPLTDIETTKLNCPHCMAGKSAKLPYPSNKNRPPISVDLNIGDKLHTDHLGPISPISRYGNKYIIEFIDGASRLAFIFGMKLLDEMFDHYSDLRNLVTTQKGIKFVLLQYKKGFIKLLLIASEQISADVLTKGLGRPLFEHKRSLCVC